MASPQVEDGYTQIANELLTHLMELYLPSNQWQVLIVIIRKTYGYRKKVDYVTNSQIVEATGLLKSNVSRALKNLTNRNVIIRQGKMIGIQKDWEKWQLSEQITKVVNTDNQPPVINVDNSEAKVIRADNNEKLSIQQPKLSILTTELSAQITKVISPRITQKKKETITKETIQKKPEFVSQESWDGFFEMRKRVKSPLTDFAIKIIIGKLEQFKNDGDDPNEVLCQSIMNNWKGVFPLKKNGGNGNGTAKRHYSTDLPKVYTKPGGGTWSPGDPIDS